MNNFQDNTKKGVKTEGIIIPKKKILITKKWFFINNFASLNLHAFLHSHHGWEGIGFMWKMTFEIFIKSLRFETPWVRKNSFYKSVCVSVCSRSCAA